MSILEHIRRGFPSLDYDIEVAVLDGSGDKFIVYRGNLAKLVEDYFQKCLKNYGCFYMFTVIGIDSELVSLADVHQSQILRSEFMWLTPPRPPGISDIDADRANLTWEETLFCGFRPPAQKDLELQYIVEVAEGQVAKSIGVASRYAADTKGNVYIPVAVRREAGKITVNDLKSATWYSARVVVLHLGERHESKAATFKTRFGKPNTPECPRVYEFPNKSAENPKEERKPAVVLQWTAPETNGSPVQRYQVQFQETLLSAGEESMADPIGAGNSDPLFVKKKKNHVSKGEGNQAGDRRPLWNQRVPSLKPSGKEVAKAEEESKRMQQQERANTTGIDVTEVPAVITGQWTVVYNNKVPKLKLLAPSPRALEWKFRVRAENKEGWSEFSPVLYMHRKSHPSLFSASYPHEYDPVYASTPNALLSPDKQSNALGLAVARPEYAASPIKSSAGRLGLTTMGMGGGGYYYENNPGGQYGYDNSGMGPGGQGQGQGQDGMYVDAYTQGLMFEAMKDMDRQRAQQMQMMPKLGGLAMDSVISNVQDEEILENMPLSAGNSGVLRSRQRPSSADSAESASMLDRRSRDSNRNSSGHRYSRGNTPLRGDARRKSAPPTQGGKRPDEGVIEEDV